MRHYPDPPKIEPIRIPTGLDRAVGICKPIGVQGASSGEQIEIMIGERRIFAQKFCRQLGTTFAMTVIAAFVDSPGVVENGEKLDYF